MTGSILLTSNSASCDLDIMNDKSRNGDLTIIGISSPPFSPQLVVKFQTMFYKHIVNNSLYNDDHNHLTNAVCDDMSEKISYLGPYSPTFWKGDKPNIIRPDFHVDDPWPHFHVPFIQVQPNFLYLVLALDTILFKVFVEFCLSVRADSCYFIRKFGHVEFKLYRTQLVKDSAVHDDMK